MKLLKNAYFCIDWVGDWGGDVSGGLPLEHQLTEGPPGWIPLAGIALLTIGALVQAKVSEAVNFLEGKVSVAPILLIVVGSIVFIISFYGCCGAIRESSCMVTTFSIFLMVILTLEIVIAVLAFVYRDVLTDDLQTSLKESVDNYHNNSTAKAEMDSLQISFQCCGANGPTDYDVTRLPPSCCTANDGNPCLPITTDLNRLAFQTGCVQALKDYVQHYGAVIGGVALGVGVVMLIGIISGLCLASSIRNESRREGVLTLIHRGGVKQAGSLPDCRVICRVKLSRTNNFPDSLLGSTF
uniref:Tetraspanin n=1 Tax=Timema poppense TaxID=170557 RepID=A0A7R9HAH6_TIMPO|nr:unnamed protein product [Timema poppensis]